MKFEFVLDKNIVIETIMGEVDFDELVSITEALHNEPEYSPEMNAILDLREVNLLLTYDEMQRYVNWLGSREKRLRGYVALITKSPLTYGVTRMYEAMGVELQEEIEYFDSIEKAISWIEEMCRRKN